MFITLNSARTLRCALKIQADGCTVITCDQQVWDRERTMRNGNDSLNASRVLGTGTNCLNKGFLQHSLRKSQIGLGGVLHCRYLGYCQINLRGSRKFSSDNSLEILFNLWSDRTTSLRADSLIDNLHHSFPPFTVSP